MDEKDYIPYMRKMIGHKRMLTVGLCCLILNEKNQLLLEKRTDNGLYCIPGGSLDFDETVIEGVKREVREETGILLKEVSLFMIQSGSKMQLSYPNGDVTDYMDLCFIARVDSKDIDLNKEHDDESSLIAFYDLDKLPKEEELLRGTKAMIDKLLKEDYSITVD
ncbi:NUDIX domain-containing protein [Treponema rectale]|uniref:NUDIX domain-containing protein n=1 Tax=Treponema rectale TaxID=744512 RepID=A0A7M1XI52_9SPIR|nr:NUDIX domain-containing protein [Treponema rectale]